MSNKIYIYIPCSKISSFCGGNKFKPQNECFFDAYKKNNLEDYQKLLKKLNREDKNFQNKFLLNNDLLQESIQNSIKTDNAKDTAKTIRLVSKMIKQELTKLSIPEEKQKVIIENVKTQAKYMINTSIGTNKEEKSLNIHEKLENLTITDRNDKLYTKFLETDKVKLKFCGKIDGIDQENKTLIEHKQRMNRLFYSIPKYERIQLMLYMYLTETEHSKLVQTYKDEQTILEMDWSDTEWENLIKSLYNSLDKYHDIITSEKKLTSLVKRYTVESLKKQKVTTITSFFN